MVNHEQFVSTLIAPKGEKKLSRKEVEAFASQLGAAVRLDWLEDGVACDIYHDLPHIGLESDMDCDLISQPTAHRRKHLLIADMDSTLIQQECIDELAGAAGMKDEIAGITERAMNGELEFEDALRARVLMLKGLTEQTLHDVFANQITLMPGAMTLARTMKASGAHLVIVSGGFTFFTERIRGELGFDEDRSNELEIRDGELTGQVIPPILGQDAKLEALTSIAADRGLAREEVLAIGDGANDVPMLQAAGLGVACHAKPFVQQQVEAQLNHNDLSALLFVQGYKRKEWV